MMASIPLALDHLRHRVRCAAVRLGLIKPPAPPVELPWLAAARKVDALLAEWEGKR